MKAFSTRSFLKSRSTAILAATTLLVASLGCASPYATNETGRTNKTAVGGLGGAVAGGLLGEALGGSTKDVLAGVALGGLLGALGGQVLDQRDRQIAAQNAQVALERAPTGTSSPWQNPDTGASGTFTPTRTYQQPNGQYCREYNQEVWVAGQREMAYGTACRQADGSWKMVQ
ncbi:MAG: RT0821/Lpp0805 family surface protein [Myxococcota bacterium]|nr:RT0821/Lpp0805 family surface protein [Myxococcota bacterium]